MNVWEEYLQSGVGRNKMIRCDTYDELYECLSCLLEAGAARDQMDGDDWTDEVLSEDRRNSRYLSMERNNLHLFVFVDTAEGNSLDAYELGSIEFTIDIGFHPKVVSFMDFVGQSVDDMPDDDMPEIDSAKLSNFLRI